MNKLDSSVIVDRLHTVHGVADDSALSVAMGQKRSTVGNWRNRGTVPYSECVKVAMEKGICLDWLLVGTGPMRRAEKCAATSENRASYHVTPAEQGILELLRSLDEADQQAIQHAARDRKRLRDLEQRLERLTITLAETRSTY